MATTFLPSPGLTSAFRASIDAALADVGPGVKAASVISAEYTRGGRPVICAATAWKTSSGWSVAAYVKTDVKDITVGTEIKKVWR